MVGDDGYALQTHSSLPASPTAQEETAPSPQACPCFPVPKSGGTTVLKSIDQELFFVQPEMKQFLFKAPFGCDVPPSGTTIDIPETSETLHILLHALNQSICTFSPSSPLTSIITAIDRMPALSISPAAFITRGAPIYNTLLSYSRQDPLEVFSLAAHHNIEPLAVDTSLRAAVALPTVSSADNDMVARIGVAYLRRIIAFQSEIRESFKRIIREAPTPHDGSPTCPKDATLALKREWIKTTSHLVWSGMECE